MFDRYDARYGSRRAGEASVVIVGGGHVGIAAGEVLGAAGICSTIVEREPQAHPRGTGTVATAATPKWCSAMPPTSTCSSVPAYGTRLRCW